MGQATVTVEIISPPADVALPAGQAVEVRYRVAGPAASSCDATIRCWRQMRRKKRKNLFTPGFPPAWARLAAPWPRLMGEA